jgi:hypothetical protein
VNELMTLFGWKSERIALSYTPKADRKRLAAGAAHKLGRHKARTNNPAPWSRKSGTQS